jgi:MFS family permease
VHAKTNSMNFRDEKAGKHMTNEDQGTVQSAAHKTRQRRLAVTSGVASDSLEYYDFAIYGLLAATIFPKLFFSGLGDTAALMASFATFGVGFFARPLGAIVCSNLGDRFGRKPVLLWTLVLMGVCSLLIGLLPTGQGVGIAAVLVVLRILQGFSLGGESTGNQLLTLEHARPGTRGLMGSIIKTGSPISQVLAALSLAVLTTTLTTEQFESWGWRIPFLASIIVVAVALFMRVKLEETPAFLATQNKAEEDTFVPAERRGFRALRLHLREVTLLSLAWCGPTISFYLITVFGATYLTGRMGLPGSSTFTIIAIANGASVIACLLGGAISDRIGRKPVAYIGLAGSAIGVTIFFAASTSDVIINGIVVTVTLCSVQFLSGAWPAFFAEQLPTEVRYSGGAMALTLPNLVLSASAPFVATAFIALGAPALIAVFAVVIILVSVFAYSRLAERGEVSLEDIVRDDTASKVTGRNG